VDTCSSRLDGTFQTPWTGQKWVFLHSLSKKDYLFSIYRRSLNYTIGAVEKIVDCRIAPRSIPSITSVLMLRATLSADRVYRSQEIAPRDVDRAAQFAHYRESEDKRDAISSLRILSSPERPARYVFSRSCDEIRARGSLRENVTTRNTYINEVVPALFYIYGGACTRARMLFLSKLSPTWNGR